MLANSKTKEIKLPRKARVSKRKVAKGGITVAVVRDNKNVDFLKTELINGTYKIDNDTFHFTDDDSIYLWKGNPIIFQPKKRNNPVNMLKGNNETYGQKVIMSRMITDTIKSKKDFAMGWIIWLVVIGVGAYLLLK